jgi:hypothetical protein
MSDIADIEIDVYAYLWWSVLLDKKKSKAEPLKKEVD